jgi:hypothetical protein
MHPALNVGFFFLAIGQKGIAAQCVICDAMKGVKIAKWHKAERPLYAHTVT